jgi:hypothetical protein
MPVVAVFSYFLGQRRGTSTNSLCSTIGATMVRGDPMDSYNSRPRSFRRLVTTGGGAAAAAAVMIFQTFERAVVIEIKRRTTILAWRKGAKPTDGRWAQKFPVRRRLRPSD